MHVRGIVVRYIKLTLFDDLIIYHEMKIIKIFVVIDMIPTNGHKCLMNDYLSCFT